MSYHLYQMWAKNSVKSGDYFPVNGPHDTHGIVVKQIEGRALLDGSKLYLIRGTGVYKRGRGRL